MNKLIKSASLVIATTAMIACGGSSSDDSSSGSGGNTAVPANIVGTYTGVNNATLSANGVSERETLAASISIRADGTVVATDGRDATTGRLDGTSFSTAGSFAPLTQNGITCSGGSQSYTGRIENVRAIGDYNASIPCSNGSQSVTIETRGSFNLERTSNSASILPAGINNSADSIMQQAIQAFN